MRTTSLLSTLLLLAALGCQASSSGEGGSDLGSADASRADVAPSDAGGDITEPTDASLDALTDASANDGGATDADADELSDTTMGDTDAGGGARFPLAGFGQISGACDVLDDELTSSEPSYIENRIDFADDPFDEADRDKLTAGGREILDDGNAGGSSLYSELFAYEVLYRCEEAELLATETEINYVDPNAKITDLLVDIDGVKIGVSVTRAIAFPFEDPYSVEQATDLLTDKLGDVAASSQNVAPEDAWQKQILHVIAYAEGHETSLQAAYLALDAALKADTILWVTVSDGDDQFLY